MTYLESTYAEAVRDYYATKFDVYCEVQYAYKRQRADIVVDQRDCLHVIEVKTSLALSLLTQAVSWREKAKLISIAIPEHHRRIHWPAVEPCVNYYGFGVILASRDRASVMIEPRLYEKAHERILRSMLHKDQRNTKPGNADNVFIPPYRITAERVVDYINRHGPTTVGEITREVNHHYQNRKSFAASLKKLIRENASGFNTLMLQKVGPNNWVTTKPNPPTDPDLEVFG